MNGFFSMSILCIPVDHFIPCHSIFIRHHIKELPSFIYIPAFAIHVNESTAYKEVIYVPLFCYMSVKLSS
uniref:Uncharacterized protein n=1 Tax=Rhizophora mucronata TaxID=61149 RepID=A0A2P2JBB3_RHIMU